MSTHEEVVRFTFDCPLNLHSFAKMKATATHQSMKDYLIGLLAKDAVDHPIKFLSNKSFEKELKHILHQDEELMKKLADR